MPEPVVQPKDGNKPSPLLGETLTPQVDERLKEFGVEPTATKEETPLETPKEETPPAETKPETPLEEEVPGVELSDAEVKAIIEAKTGKEQSAAETEDYPWVKENREPTEKEVLDYVSAKAIKEIEDKQKAKEEETKKAEEEQKKAEAERVQSWNKYWDDQISDLEKEGLLPAVKDEKDPNDPGNKARYQLWETAVAQKDNPSVDARNLRLIYFEFIHPNKGKQPAGANAPVVQGHAGSGVPSNEVGYTYDEIHNADTEHFTKDLQL